jgi:hypothetical protein
MTGPNLNPAEALRDSTSAMNPDPRTSMFTGQSSPSLAAHHAEIARVKLPEAPRVSRRLQHWRMEP